jgi:4-hydroxythreonine-4-phosphate dehydrogenase
MSGVTNRSSKSTVGHEVASKRLLITTGDPDGIGSEVTAKALADLGPQVGYQFVIYRSPHIPQAHLRLLDKKFRRHTLTEGDIWPNEFHNHVLIDIVSDSPPARWVEAAAVACKAGRAHGMVTAPLSKTGIAAAGLRDRGHTEILQRICRVKDVYMAFWGRHFKVVLLTDHRPLMAVGKSLTPRRIRVGVQMAKNLRGLAKSRLPIGLVGLNPHAGENGLLGKEEKKFRSVLRSTDVVGPLVPDTAFLPDQWKKFSVYVCPYHDQGLIPFKLVHGFDEGVHLTLGLPFVRTSVDHGTAKELFGQDKAKYGSMREAIELAMSLRSAR